MEPKYTSAAGLISIGNKAANIVSFVSFVLWCIFYSCILKLQHLYNCFRPAFKLFSYLLLNKCKTSHDHPSHEGPDVSASPRPRPVREVHAYDVTREDVALVMERLGLYEEPLEDSFEIANVFDKLEPSLEEVREAFGLFDENSDGFIDARELKRVINSLGLTGYSEQECQKMIMAFDDDGDGRIDCSEFAKLMENCTY